jgi:3-oxoacyl-[acyl-carrier-protein] synthase III
VDRQPRTGIRERRVAAAHETTASMASVAGARAIAVAGLDPDEIDLILVATLTPDYWMPSTAALVKEAIGNTARPRWTCPPPARASSTHTPRRAPT